MVGEGFVVGRVLVSGGIGALGLWKPFRSKSMFTDKTKSVKGKRRENF